MEITTDYLRGLLKGYAEQIKTLRILSTDTDYQASTKATKKAGLTLDTRAAHIAYAYLRAQPFLAPEAQAYGKSNDPVTVERRWRQQTAIWRAKKLMEHEQIIKEKRIVVDDPDFVAWVERGLNDLETRTRRDNERQAARLACTRLKEGRQAVYVQSMAL